MYNHLKIREIQGYTINKTIFTQMHLGMPSWVDIEYMGGRVKASTPGTWPNIQLVLVMPYLSSVFSRRKWDCPLWMSPWRSAKQWFQHSQEASSDIPYEVFSHCLTFLAIKQAKYWSKNSLEQGRLETHFPRCSWWTSRGPSSSTKSHSIWSWARRAPN